MKRVRNFAYLAEKLVCFSKFADVFEIFDSPDLEVRYGKEI
jgi:hypothetical protein